jgi:hypothetical protein
MTMKMLIAIAAVAAIIAVPASAKVLRDTGPNAVIFNGKVIGTDPDAGVRTMLQRDWEYQGRPRGWIGD